MFSKLIIRTLGLNVRFAWSVLIYRMWYFRRVCDKWSMHDFKWILYCKENCYDSCRVTGRVSVCGSVVQGNAEQL